MSYYKVEELSSPPWGWFVPFAVTGNRVVGYGGLSTQAVLWDGFGSALDLNSPAGVSSSQSMAMAVNGVGDVVGSWAEESSSPEGLPILSPGQAFVRKADGSTQYLGSILRGASYLLGISDAGLAIGRENIGDGPTAGENVWTYDIANGSLSDLGRPDGSLGAFATSINKSGEIVGVATARPRPRGFLLRNGVFSDLGPVSGIARITDSGLVGGNAVIAGVLRAAIYDSAQPALGWQGLGTGAECTDVNDGGVAVGHSFGPTPSETRAWVWSAAAGIEDLTTLVGPGWRLQFAAGINAAGQIVGWGERRDPGSSAWRPVTYRATPAPAPNYHGLPELLRWWPLLKRHLPDWGPYPRWNPRVHEAARGVTINELTRRLRELLLPQETPPDSLDEIMKAVDRLRRGRDDR